MVGEHDEYSPSGRPRSVATGQSCPSESPVARFPNRIAHRKMTTDRPARLFERLGGGQRGFHGCMLTALTTPGLSRKSSMSRNSQLIKKNTGKPPLSLIRPIRRSLLPTTLVF